MGAWLVLFALARVRALHNLQDRLRYEFVGHSDGQLDVLEADERRLLGHRRFAQTAREPIP